MQTFPEKAHGLYDISDHVWRLFKPYFLGREGLWGGPCQETTGNLINDFLDFENRRFVG
ncbi:hypothetical protein [Holospora curviuscula]|uniref:Transposase n=1 Tax=Holospora curviuscula TaxID=1082868 RepID=A0A2S5R9P7_9PROT|nr:hypothetical protein [Holospora curviuscula]PPE04049.1 hypothetical protein HCUR_00584 [Holospora curviuscula]